MNELRTPVSPGSHAMWAPEETQPMLKSDSSRSPQRVLGVPTRVPAGWRGLPPALPSLLCSRSRQPLFPCAAVSTWTKRPLVPRVAGRGQEGLSWSKGGIPALMSVTNLKPLGGGAPLV